VSDLHFCGSDGYLVGPAEWLPDEPFDFHWPITSLIIGCNQLECSRCKTRVKSALAGDARHYSCGCSQLDVMTLQSVQQPLDPITEATLPWRCAGHPPLALPVTLDGVALDDATDWPALARQVFSGARDLHPHPSTRGLRGFWWQRLYNITAGALHGAIARAAAALLLDREPRVRVAAVVFYDNNFDADGADQLAQAARDRPELFIGVKDPDSETFTLWDWMAESLGGRMTRDPLALSVMKDHALAGPGVGRALYPLARQDLAWVLDNAVAILDAAPARWSTLLNALSAAPAEDVVALARMVRQRGLASEAQLLEFAQKNLAVPVSAEIRRALTSSN
jgi:hypothetical protein